MDIKERYRPYNFSSTKCYVIRLPFSVDPDAPSYIGIEEKLPYDIGRLKGVYVTSYAERKTERRPSSNFAAGVVLSFNEGTLKSVQVSFWNPSILMDHSHPIPLDEEIFSNSLMQGWFIAMPLAVRYQGYLSIYLHYEPRCPKQ